MRVSNTSGGTLRPIQDVVKLEPQQSIFDFSMEFYDGLGNQIDPAEVEMEPRLYIQLKGGSWQYFNPYSLVGRIGMALPIFSQIRDEEGFEIFTMDKAGNSYHTFITAPEHPFENGMIYRFDEPLKMQRLMIWDEGGH